MSVKTQSFHFAPQGSTGNLQDLSGGGLVATGFNQNPLDIFFFLFFQRGPRVGFQTADGKLLQVAGKIPRAERRSVPQRIASAGGSIALSFMDLHGGCRTDFATRPYYNGMEPSQAPRLNRASF